MMDTATLLLEFSAKTGVAGLEQEAADYARTLLEPLGWVTVSPLGSVLCTVCPPREGRPHLLLDAHLDEIGMIVTHIHDSGFLKVAGCGGVDRRILLAYPVTVHGTAGPLNGVICSVPPHLTEGEGKNKKVDEIYIDIGCSTGEEAKELVRPGDRITFQFAGRRLLGGQVCGKALDDRAGCISLLKAVEYLEGNLPDCGLTIAFSSMEEVGGQGAKTASYQTNPTHAVAVDVSFAHTPDSAREKTGEMGKGPMIGISPILSRRCSDKLAELAKAAGIPFQLEVMGGRTGTNADDIAVTRGGVETALLSIPQKYMHTPIEAVAVEDVEHTAKLIAGYIRALDKGEL